MALQNRPPKTTPRYPAQADGRHWRMVPTSLIVDQIQKEFQYDDTICVTWLYYDYRDIEQQTPQNMIDALLSQATTQLSLSCTLSQDVVCTLLAEEKIRRTRSVATLDLKEKLDALDECKDEYRRGLLQSLRDLISQSSLVGHSTSIFFTSRGHVDDHVKRHLIEQTKSEAQFTPMHLEANPSDISRYVLNEIENDINDVIMDETFKEEIVSEIIRSSNRMFVSPLG
ncbi:hypothetical protein FPQ18DRAFT_395921 [Pyronema domesticum]|nr:hypothetical protein FPQ18DRAFT_395921 [Pyronema domesticum]